MDEAENAFTLKDVQDADVLKKALMTLTPKHAVVVGGGFGGLAMAENLQRLGLTVTIVEKKRQVVGAFDFEMAQILHRELNVHGVGLVLDDGVSRFENKGKTLVLESGRTLDCDLSILTCLLYTSPWKTCGPLMRKLWAKRSMPRSSPLFQQ